MYLIENMNQLLLCLHSLSAVAHLRNLLQLHREIKTDIRERLEQESQEKRAKTKGLKGAKKKGEQ